MFLAVNLRALEPVEGGNAFSSEAIESEGALDRV